MAAFYFDATVWPEAAPLPGSDAPKYKPGAVSETKDRTVFTGCHKLNGTDAVSNEFTS